VWTQPTCAWLWFGPNAAGQGAGARIIVGRGQSWLKKLLIPATGSSNCSGGQLEDPDAAKSGYEQSLQVGAATACCKFTKGVAPDFILYVYILDAQDKFDCRKAGGGEDFILREAKVIARLLATAHIATAEEAAASMGEGTSIQTTLPNRHITQREN